MKTNLAHTAPCQTHDYDLSDPAGFLLALWEAQYGDHIPSDLAARFWDRDLDSARRHHPAIFDLSGNSNPADAVRRFLSEISIGRQRVAARDRSVSRAWFHVFHAAFAQGLIGSLAWSKAARQIYCASAGYGAGNPNAAVLPGLRDATPRLLMTRQEFCRWFLLPPQVTLYRGTCASDFGATWQGVSWTANPHLAASFARVRTTERYDEGRCEGWPRLVQAQVPKSAVIALIGGLAGDELLVDYEKLTPSAVKDLRPLAPAEIDAERVRIRNELDATRTARARAGLLGRLEG